jgi:hypothetical protein
VAAAERAAQPPAGGAVRASHAHDESVSDAPQAHRVPVRP